MYELIIIGGGPAGTTAAVYAARKKIHALLIAKEIGGQVITTSSIENYMGYQYVSGFELMEKFEAQMKQFPIDSKLGEEVISIFKIADGFEVITQAGKNYQARSVIVCTGKLPRRLNVPGEARLLGRGVSYCATCDGPLFSGEKVAVIGGGNSALEAVDDMLKIADTVYAIMDTNFTGDAVLVDKVKNNPKLVVYYYHQVLEVTGDKKVEGIILQDTKTGEIRKLEVGGVFVEVGLFPNSSLVNNLAQINSSSEIEVNCNCESSVPGLFAAGDVASTPEKQIIIAAGDGAKAALQAHRYLQRS